MSTRRTEVFENMRTQGFVYLTPVNSTNTNIAGTYPGMNNVFQAVDNTGNAEFRPDVTCVDLHTQTLTSSTGNIRDITVTNASFGTINDPSTTSWIANGNANTTGALETSRIGLSGGVTLDISGGTIIGWKRITAPNTKIPLLPPSATLVDVVRTFNTLQYTLSALVNYTGPAPPQNVVATPGSSQASVSWTATTASSYTVKAFPGPATATTSGTSATVTGLTNGIKYAFLVIATTPSGDIQSSLSNTVVPG